MKKLLRTLSAIMTLQVLLAVPLWSAIGDNAPPIPSTYKASHPRLNSPDSGFLTSLSANSLAMGRYNAAADAWSSTNPGNTSQLRRLVIAYMANKIANPAKAATYLQKIKALADLGGTWGPLLYAVNDGVGNGTYTLTSASANFLTGCGGASCQGQLLSINARTYIVSSVPTANTVVLSASNPAPNGANLKVRIFSDSGFSGINIALIYDWLYNDLDETTRAEFLSQLDVLCTIWEENYIGLRASPYNDVFYIRLGTFGLIGALASYPDHPNSSKHMKFMTDVWFNTLLPVWRQVFGPEGGGWHEGWPDYVSASNGSGLTTFLVPSLLSWQSATGDPIFTRESWLKNFAYFTMYMTRPDFTMEHIGDTSRPYLMSEYDLRIGSGLGSINGLAEIYNDPVLRGWARVINKEFPSGPDGFEPSAWPFYTPDKNSNPVTPRSALSPVRNFSGWGVLAMRSGWTENDTAVTLKYGDNFWSHEHFDTGAFTIFNRGNLAIDSGTYRAGSASKHQNQYARQTIAHNSLTITDPADSYPTTFSSFDENGNAVQLPIPNDGGQRRVGTGYNERFPQFVSPNMLGDWLKNWDYYHTGKMVSFAPTANYTYTAVDITAAYNNKFSASAPNATNRTNRVQKAVRHMLFIPRGTAAYVVVFDQVVSTNASFVKRWLLHTVNQPTVNGSSYTVTRADLIKELPYNWTQEWASQLKNCPNNDCSSGNNYQYAGKLYGWMVQPQAGTISVVGGPGKEFWIEDPKNPGTGTNWNQCMRGQCDANTEGLGGVDNFINPDPKTAPHEPGSWRIEVKPLNPATQDFFLNVMLATSVSDANVPVNVTVPANLPAGMVGATWTEGGKVYTVTFPKDGVGGHVNISGLVDEELLSHAQKLPDQIEIVSGASQTGSAASAVASPLVVIAKDSAGNPVPNAVVHFGITEGDGRVSSEIATTDSQGKASATLFLGAGAAGSVTKVMANINGVTPVEFTATVVGGSTSTSPSLSSLSCAPAALASAATSTCTVVLTQAAASGVTVSLNSSTSVVTIPAGVLVPSGATSATFSAQAGTVSASQNVVLTAVFNSVSKTTSLTVAPAATTLPSLLSIACAPTALATQETATCSVTLSQAAGAGGATVPLSSNTAQLTVPASALVPVGSTTASFTVSSGTISGSQAATITATLNGSSQTTLLNLSAPNSGGGVPIPTNSWTMIPTQGLPVQTVGFEKLVYAGNPVKKAVMLGNYQQLGTEPNQSLIAYDFESNRWNVLDIGASFHSEHMPESGHPSGQFAYNPNDKTFIYYCCTSGSNQPENLYSTWWFDAVGQTGRSKQTSPKPGMVQLASSTFDAANNRFVLHGGGSFVGTWTYDPSANTYQKMSPAGTLPDPSVSQHSMTYNTSDQKVYLFGGSAGGGFSNDLFTYDVRSNTWAKLNPSGVKPAPRMKSGFAYDSVNNVFLVYGGEDGSVVYNDSWIYNPTTNAWIKLNPTQAPPLGMVGPFETLVYDSDHNVFILVLAGARGYAGGNSGVHAAQTWFFRYQGTGPNAGTAQGNFQPSAGGMNRNIDGWAKEPSIAGAGDSLYGGWVETGRPFDITTTNPWFHTYVSQFSNGGWAPLGGASTSIDSEFNGYTESHSPSITIVGGKPWISWYKWNNSSEVWGLWAKSWNGTAWQGGPIGRVGSDKARAFQGRSQMADVGGVPHIAFLEVDKSFYPQKTFVYVKYWDGTQWVLKGTGALNIQQSANTTAGSVSISSDGTNPYVAWTEYTSDGGMQNQTASQVYVARWNGTQWTSIGSSINASANAWADDVSIAYLGGRPYVAWTERSAGGDSHVFVKQFNGSGWVFAGSGDLTKDGNTGWAFGPRLVADANSLYLGWVEQQTLGKTAQVYVSKFSGNSWTALGGSLNVNSALGSAQRVSLTIAGGQPVAAWGEVNFGAVRQVFAKQWNGSAWTQLRGTSSLPPQPPPVSSENSCDLNSDGSVNVLDVQESMNQAIGAAPCGTADLLRNGQCSIVDVQRVINAALGSACVVGP